MTLVQPRGFCPGDSFEVSFVVNLELMEFPFLRNKTSCQGQWSLSKASIKLKKNIDFTRN